MRKETLEELLLEIYRLSDPGVMGKPDQETVKKLAKMLGINIAAWE